MIAGPTSVARKPGSANRSVQDIPDHQAPLSGREYAIPAWLASSVILFRGAARGAAWRSVAYSGEMSDVTEILSRIEAGDPRAAEGLLPLVYDQVRELAASRMVNERPDHTLQGTALVHEAYLRLVGSANGQSWQNRGHSFAAAAEAMRRIPVDWARAKKSQERGGGRERLELQDFVGRDAENADMLLDLDEGLSPLTRKDAESAELVKLRLFAGLSVTEAGRAMGISRTAAYENWEFARPWFARRLGEPLHG